MSAPMMVCGCRAMATHSQDHDGLGASHQSCVVHDCCTVSNTQPDLAGRVARCGYRDCQQERPSSLDLPFFKYRGPASYDANTMCAKCPYSIQPHWPKWRVELRIARLWYKRGRIVQTVERTGYSRPERVALWAEHEAEFFRSQRHPESKVFGVTYDAPREIPNDIGHAFVAHGPYEYDDFYCGCKGWD